MTLAYVLTADTDHQLHRQLLGYDNVMSGDAVSGMFRQFVFRPTVFGLLKCPDE